MKFLQSSPVELASLRFLPEELGPALEGEAAAFGFFRAALPPPGGVGGGPRGDAAGIAAKAADCTRSSRHTIERALATEWLSPEPDTVD